MTHNNAFRHVPSASWARGFPGLGERVRGRSAAGFQHRCCCFSEALRNPPGPCFSLIVLSRLAYCVGAAEVGFTLHKMKPYNGLELTSDRPDP